MSPHPNGLVTLQTYPAPPVIPVNTPILFVIPSKVYEISPTPPVDVIVTVVVSP